MKPLIVALLLLSSCAARQPLDVQKRTWTTGPGWSVAEDAPGKWIILAQDANATEAARKYICGEKFICIGPEFIGELSELERFSK